MKYLKKEIQSNTLVKSYATHKLCLTAGYENMAGLDIADFVNHFRARQSRIPIQVNKYTSFLISVLLFIACRLWNCLSNAGVILLNSINQCDNSSTGDKSSGPNDFGIN